MVGSIPNAISSVCYGIIIMEDVEAYADRKVPSHFTVLYTLEVCSVSWFGKAVNVTIFLLV